MFRFLAWLSEQVVYQSVTFVMMLHNEQSHNQLYFMLMRQ